MIELEIKIECGDEKKAKIINDSIKVDNEGYVKSYVRKKYVIAKMKGDALSLLHTFNDFISCLQLSFELV